MFTGQEFVCKGSAWAAVGLGVMSSGCVGVKVPWSELVLDGLHEGCCCYVGVGWPRHENMALCGECLVTLAEAG